MGRVEPEEIRIMVDIIPIERRIKEVIDRHPRLGHSSAPRILKLLLESVLGESSEKDDSVNELYRFFEEHGVDIGEAYKAISSLEELVITTITRHGPTYVDELVTTCFSYKLPFSGTMILVIKP